MWYCNHIQNTVEHGMAPRVEVASSSNYRSPFLFFKMFLPSQLNDPPAEYYKQSTKCKRQHKLWAAFEMRYSGWTTDINMIP